MITRSKAFNLDNEKGPITIVIQYAMKLNIK